MVDSWTSNRPFSSRSRAASLRASSRVPACAGHGRQVDGPRTVEDIGRRSAELTTKP